MNEERSEDMYDLLGAYALDAIDPEEREMVERFLATDDDARAEVDVLRETASVLASLPREDAGAPEGLWEKIAGSIGAPEIALHEVRAETAGAGVDASTAEPMAQPIPISRAKRFAAVPSRVFLPIVAAAAIIIAVLAVQVATRPPSRAGDLAAAYTQAVSHGATTLDLHRDSGGTVAAKIALGTDGTGYIRNAGLQSLPSGKTYQLWEVIGTSAGQRVISAGVLGGDVKTAAFHVTGKPDAFAITVEDAPGVVVSAVAPTAVGTVPA